MINKNCSIEEHIRFVQEGDVTADAVGKIVICEDYLSDNFNNDITEKVMNVMNTNKLYMTKQHPGFLNFLGDLVTCNATDEQLKRACNDTQFTDDNINVHVIQWRFISCIPGMNQINTKNGRYEYWTVFYKKNMAWRSFWSHMKAIPPNQRPIECIANHCNNQYDWGSAIFYFNCCHDLCGDDEILFYMLEHINKKNWYDYIACEDGEHLLALFSRQLEGDCYPDRVDRILKSVSKNIAKKLLVKCKTNGDGYSYNQSCIQFFLEYPGGLDKTTWDVLFKWLKDLSITGDELYGGKNDFYYNYEKTNRHPLALATIHNNKYVFESLLEYGFYTENDVLNWRSEPNSHRFEKNNLTLDHYAIPRHHMNSKEAILHSEILTYLSKYEFEYEDGDLSLEERWELRHAINRSHELRDNYVEKIEDEAEKKWYSDPNNKSVMPDLNIYRPDPKLLLIGQTMFDDMFKNNRPLTSAELCKWAKNLPENIWLYNVI